jgi:hypothetical protein
MNTTTTKNEYSGSCCVDCLMFLANGDLSLDDDEGAAAWLDGFVSRNDGVVWVVGASTDDCGHDLSEPDEYDDHVTGCESFGFRAYSPCDLCGSSLGGDRYAVTGWDA